MTHLTSEAVSTSQDKNYFMQLVVLHVRFENAVHFHLATQWELEGGCLIFPKDSRREVRLDGKTEL